MITSRKTQRIHVQASCERGVWTSSCSIYNYIYISMHVHCTIVHRRGNDTRVQSRQLKCFYIWGCTTRTGYFKCREVKTGFYRNKSMQTGSSGTLIGWKSGQTTFVPLWDRMEGAWLRTLLWDASVYTIQTQRKSKRNTGQVYFTVANLKENSLKWSRV